MTPRTAALMAQYNRWMNQRMYEAARTLPQPAAPVARDAGVDGSRHGVGRRARPVEDDILYAHPLTGHYRFRVRQGMPCTCC